MKKIIIPVVIIFLFSCDDESPSKNHLLTNGSSKGWYITTVSTDANEECDPDGDMMRDNTWTFYSDGKFMYDHGTIIESGECGDTDNFTGTWKFEQDESVLTIFAAFNTDDPDDIINDEFLSAKIVELTGDKLVVEENGSQGTFIPR